ncbi:MAG: hypothetical protein MUC88_15960 [Planctomycetes bacterium]|jgi:uncharacterized membrane protein|nr:hypothetical protein [Planctomycetota bacterium]
MIAIGIVFGVALLLGALRWVTDTDSLALNSAILAFAAFTVLLVALQIIQKSQPQ